MVAAPIYIHLGSFLNLLMPNSMRGSGGEAQAWAQQQPTGHDPGGAVRDRAAGKTLGTVALVCKSKFIPSLMVSLSSSLQLLSYSVLSQIPLCLGHIG